MVIAHIVPPVTSTSVRAAVHTIGLILVASGLASAEIVRTDYGDVEVVVDRGEELGTTYEVRLVVPKYSEHDAEALLADGREHVRALESRYSEWLPESEISRINALAARSPVPISDDMRTLLEGAGRVSELTDGAFDVTWKPLDAIWNVARGAGRVPSTAEIATVIGAVDHRHVVIADSTIRFRDPDTQLGIAGVAKGWIIDALFNELARAGLDDIIVNIGGDLRTIGGETDGRRTILVVDPYETSRTAAVLRVGESAVATSGNYLRASIAGTTPMGHILDPRTGFPPEFDGSVTVLTRDAAMADALATALFVMGPDAGLELARALVGVDVVYVDRAGVRSTLDGSHAAISLELLIDDEQ